MNLCLPSCLNCLTFFRPSRLVHAITPSEENKSFLEKVQMGEMLCGIPEEDRLYFGLAARPSPASTYSQLTQSLHERLQRPPPHVWSDGSDDDEDR